MLQQLGECLQPARRGAYADDGKTQWVPPLRFLRFAFRGRIYRSRLALQGQVQLIVGVCTGKQAGT